MGLNIGRAEALGAKLVFWDLGGQVGLRTIWEKYYGEAHAVVRLCRTPLPPCVVTPTRSVAPIASRTYRAVGEESVWSWAVLHTATLRFFRE